MHTTTFSLRLTGFLLSLLFTLVAYFIMIQPDLFFLKPTGAVFSILVLAIFQSLVQSLFFLDIGREKKPYWNLVVFISTLSIVIIVVAFSIWIMDHLNYHMMPMP